MSLICVKLHQRENKKYRKILSTEETIFPTFEPKKISSLPYTSGATQGDNEWFYIENARSQNYSIDLLSEAFTTSDFDSLTKKEFSKIDFLFVLEDKFISFQNISPSKLISQKKVFFWGEQFKYKTDCTDIIVQDLPDAIYEKSTNRLFFQRLESITGIFKGIDTLYREATQQETDAFLKNDFIELESNYSSSDVKVPNRKRIALATKTLLTLNESDKKHIFKYIGDYCPELKKSKKAFKISNENELKMLLYGIEQRFYTTPIGNEKRLANSVITLNKGKLTK